MLVCRYVPYRCHPRGGGQESSTAGGGARAVQLKAGLGLEHWRCGVTTRPPCTQPHHGTITTILRRADRCMHTRTQSHHVVLLPTSCNSIFNSGVASVPRKHGGDAEVILTSPSTTSVDKPLSFTNACVTWQQQASLAAT